VSDGIMALCTGLRTLGVECVFGVPGTQNVPLFEGLRRSSLRTVLASHELAAAFMANGYYRATGRVAALATIPGPGFTYALTGLAEARLDSVGMLYLVGKPATSPGRHFQLQAIDQRAIAAPIVKGSFMLERAEDVPTVLSQAHALTLEGEPGPVMIEIDFAALAAGSASTPFGISASAPSPPHGLAELGAVFASAERPVLLLGQGAVACAERLWRMVDALRIPVLTTPSARGIISEVHPMVLGFDSLRGHTAEMNRFLDRADLVVALGCKLGHNGSAGFELRLPSAKFIHVDSSAAVPGANYEARLTLVGRVEDALDEMEARRTPTRWIADEVANIRMTVRTAPAARVEPKIQGATTMTPEEFFGWLREVLPTETIVVTDSGLHQILTRRYYEVRSARGLVCPTDFQSMGFGLPAAIGAKLAAPGRPVVVVVGDGGFLMSGMELLTALREEVPVVTIVFNDGQLNQIRLQQLAGYGHAHAVRLRNPDYGALAESFGIAYLRFGEASRTDIVQALNGTTPTLIEVIVGDTMAMRTMRVTVRAKGVARAMLGNRLRRWVKARLGRMQGS
jgi:acetolactate synthase-1/2/3 large subunit